MKTKGIRILTPLILILLISSLLCMSSCSLEELDAALAGSASASGGSTGGDGKYMTEEEIKALIDKATEGLTVNGGDTIDINIESSSDRNILAASKGLLSAVSITSNFKITNTYFSYLQGYYTTIEDASSAGSGVIYKLDKDRGDAYIITNFHVVYNSKANTQNHVSDDIRVYLYGQEYDRYSIDAEYIGGSSQYDIAVLKVSGSAVLKRSIARAADFADSKTVAVLDTAIAIGNPEAGGISATVGAVNVDSETINITNLEGTGITALRVMRIDVAVNGGNSGGGLFNDKGEVIGIVNAKMSASSVDNIGYAIPSNVAKNVADNIIYYDSVNPTNDSVKRAIIGVTPTVGEAYAVYDSESGRVHKMERVAVADVLAGSAADGKLQKGDILNSITIDGVTYEITRTFDVFDAMLTVRVTESFASTVSFNVTRGEQPLDVVIDVSTITPENS